MNIATDLNDKQKEAVLCTEGPLLILAGAGSGKTRVLTHRIAYLVESKKAEPYEIMAITFTNKAAGEMKERVSRLIPCGDNVWVATFHATCVRILRRHIDALGYAPDFTIYDTDDSKALIKRIIKDLQLDTKTYKERRILSYISAYKNEMLGLDDAMKDADSFVLQKTAEIFAEYEKRLKQNNALDFDDLLTKTVTLFREKPEILAMYQRRFRYVMVDEYQDTNMVQFAFLSLLTKEHGNLAVVGDDDQSIYRFRGADIRNILEFEKRYPNTKVVKLEQNYRSTTPILAVANAVIAHNRNRKDKALWSSRKSGELVDFRQFARADEEARQIIADIDSAVNYGNRSYADFAILYRTNAQSRLFEESCIRANIPYTIVGGINFYQRAEIKDILAYLKTIDSGRDSLSTERIINVPKRGIGASTVEQLLTISKANSLSLMDVISRANEFTGPKIQEKLRPFADLISRLRSDAETMPIGELIRHVVEEIGYYETLEDLEPDQAEAKKENIEELISKGSDFVAAHPDEVITVTDFLEEVALVADIDSVEADADKMLLMTAHGAKGLEFPVVYVTGLEEQVFPSAMAIGDEDPEAVEDERRLAYVAFTRAKDELHLSAARARTRNGETSYNNISRFVKEIPNDLLKDLSEYDEHNYVGNSLRSGSAFVSGKGKSDTGAKFGLTFKVTKPASLAYTVGDRVSHIKFGEGTVKEIVDGDPDFEVTVDFDDFGERVLMASFARLEKIS